MRVLVTGGTGYLGRTLVRALAARGHEVVVFARSASASGLPGTAVDADVRGRGALERPAAGCDAISHSAALVSIWRKRPADFDEVNVGGLRNVIDVATLLGVHRVVYTSSFLALPPRGHDAPLEANDYQRTKVAADRLAHVAVANGCPVVRVYPGVIYGPGSLTEGNLIGRLIADHLRHRLPGLVGPEHLWSCAYVDDVAAGLCGAIERGRIGGRYPLGGENVPQWRVFGIVSKITGRRAPLRIPFPVASALGAVEEFRAAVFGGRPLVTRGAVDIFRHDWPLDSTMAADDLGYAITPLEEGLRRTVASIRESILSPGEGGVSRI
jgi:NAD+-dependent farnesol dehydrogenase